MRGNWIKLKFMVCVFLAALWPTTVHSIVLQLIRESLQNNIAGAPIVHQISVFNFDPDVPQKLRPQYYELHGYHGNRIIQRIGLGYDGKYAERLAQQTKRDRGRLQGALYRKEYALLANRNYPPLPVNY